MCLIALKTRGAHLAEDEIRYDFATNPNGGGFMYVKDGMVHWEKGFFKADDLIKRWNATVTDDMIAALHTRIATHGKHNCTQLCHPFPLDGSDVYRASGSAKLMLMHNGIISNSNVYSKFAQPGDSDTSAFARRLSKMLRKRLPDAKMINFIKSLDNRSRFLFLSGTGDYVTMGDWVEEDGILFSHHGFLGKDRTFADYQKHSRAVWEYTYEPVKHSNALQTASSTSWINSFNDDDFYSNTDLVDEWGLDWELVDDTAEENGLVPYENLYSYGELAGSYSSDKHYYVDFDPNSLETEFEVYSYNIERDFFDLETDVVFVVPTAPALYGM